MEGIVVLSGARTPWAEYAGTPGFGRLKDVGAVDLAVAAGREAIRRSGLDPASLDSCIVGNALQTGSDAIYGARHVALKAGLPIESGALTVNRLCGSGLEAVVQAARLIGSGESSGVLAGGMENLSQAAHVVRGLRGEPVRFGRDLQLVDSLFEALRDPLCGRFMAETSDALAKRYGISRGAQDEYALRSHREGVRAAQAGLFREEIVAVETKRGPVDADDHLKPDTSLEKLAALKASFGAEATVTAGNASGIVDGAACVVVVPERRAKDASVRPLGRVVASAVVGVPPEIMGIGPAPAIRETLRHASMGLDDIDLFEINEAFAGQVLAVEKELGLNRARLNVNGGSIALGHPLGATGTRLLLTLLLELRRRGGRRGIASACIGGGQGIAVLVEAA